MATAMTVTATPMNTTTWMDGSLERTPNQMIDNRPRTSPPPPPMRKHDASRLLHLSNIPASIFMPDLELNDVPKEYVLKPRLSGGSTATLNNDNKRERTFRLPPRRRSRVSELMRQAPRRRPSRTDSCDW
mmetsp:Transcript_78914/g.118609  ORF Transcript_78914/g.118609 Transcript_78914/m.118609 type:complete len:130 (+) Transcript_78914:77-466(+)